MIQRGNTYQENLKIKSKSEKIRKVKIFKKEKGLRKISTQKGKVQTIYTKYQQVLTKVSLARQVLEYHLRQNQPRFAKSQKSSVT